LCDDAAVTDIPTRPRSGAQAVERALAVLRCVEAADTGLGVTELARRTGLTMSTSHRLARALAEEGLLAQDPDTERYVLGPALIVLGQKAEQRLGYRQAQPALTTLATATGESVNLGIRAGNDVHVVLAVRSRQPLRFDQESGSRVPLHVSAMGKCLLAGPGDLDERIGRLGALERTTDRAITDRARLRQELELVRERGWALNDEERNPGVRAIAAPVRQGDRTVAAVAIQGPTVRLTDARLPELAGQLAETVAEIAPLLPAHR
jgi:IclR family transcriptional regulator, acetate operon repressor